MKFLFALIILTGCALLVKPIAGSFNPDIEEAKNNLSPTAKKIIEDSFKGIDLTCLMDSHVHAVGNGENDSGNWVNLDMDSILNPYKKIQFEAYISASGIKDFKHVESEYNKRLFSLLSAEPRYGRILYFAFAWYRNPDGSINKKKSTFHIDNDYVYNLSKVDKRIIPVISVHPDAPNAVSEIERFGKLGVKFIKWLPAAMRIDAADHKHKAFYEMVKKYGMTIISHAGEEKAVDSEENQALGNPLKLRYPLSLGVKVIAAHAASRGECTDLDDPKHVPTDCFKLFWRMFQNPKWEGLLFADMSAITLYERVGEPIETLLKHPEMHHRLVNGSDYPLPAINILFRTSQMKRLGYITEDEAKALNEIYNYNPLVFDFALKRTLRLPKTGEKFLPVAFTMPKEIGCFKN